MRKFTLLLGLSTAGCMAPFAAMACATCGCTLSADAATGYSSATGWRLNLEMDYIDQDQLRSGTAAATPAQVVNHPSNPSLGGGEIEKQTINRYFTLGIAYAPSSSWNFDVLIPYIDRDHTTYGTQPTPYSSAETAPDQVSSARVSSLGDIKLLANYQGLLATHNLGVQLGIKLPTGQYGTHVNFATGPGAGSPLDASLQAGTGSTDLIVGAYYYQAVSQNFDAFINGQYQAAVAHAQNQPGNDFKPGSSATVSFGLRYEESPVWIPQLQVNLVHKNADSGALADTPDTAGTVAYLSPGITVRVMNRLHVYGFVQVPVLSNLEGYQLFPHWTASIGGAFAF
ncbi:MAG TPA: hypothetical protein VMC02_11770 [Steroidobacteraceae bacterium]|nr:hypothetical protein [Steroidobacteraceae bacterium]